MTCQKEHIVDPATIKVGQRYKVTGPNDYHTGLLDGIYMVRKEPDERGILRVEFGRDNGNYGVHYRQLEPIPTDERTGQPWVWKDGDMAIRITTEVVKITASETGKYVLNHRPAEPGTFEWKFTHVDRRKSDQGREARKS